MYREITKSDVGKQLFNAFGRQWSVSSFIGCILNRDVGKRVFLCGNVLYVENDEQRAIRIYPLCWSGKIIKGHHRMVFADRGSHNVTFCEEDSIIVARTSGGIMIGRTDAKNETEVVDWMIYVAAQALGDDS